MLRPELRHGPIYVEEPLLIEASAVSFQTSELADDKDEDRSHDDVDIVSEGKIIKLNGDIGSRVCVHDLKVGKVSLMRESKCRQPTCKAVGSDSESPDLKRHFDLEPEPSDLESEPVIKKKRKTTSPQPASAQSDPSSKDSHQTTKQAGRSKVSKCVHGRRKSRCRDCGGGSICEHGREKSRCKECGGGSICEHGRIKSQCKDCGGSSFCEHGRIKYRCKECRPRRAAAPPD